MAVARRETKQTREMPADLLLAIERGELSENQLRQLIAFEAAELDLSFDEAVQRARKDSLPKNAIGADLELLIELLPA